MTDSKPRNLIKVVNDDHKQSLMSGLRDLWSNNCYADTLLVGRNQSGFGTISVNKLYLAVVSQKFSRLLAETEDEIKIIFPDTDIQVLKLFVNFIYLGQIVVNTGGNNSLPNEIESFLSEWDIQHTQTFSEEGSISVDQYNESNTVKQCFSNPNLQTLFPDSELTIFPTKSSDQTAKLDKLLCRTYSRKKKPCKPPLVRLEVIPNELNVTTKERPIDLENTVDTPVTTYDYTSATHMKDHEDMTETLSDDICGIFTNAINAKSLKKEEERNKELSNLLGTLTEKTRRYRLYVKHITDASRKPTNSTEVSKPNYIPCKTCGKEVQRDYMASHEKIHAGERPYLCELCGATFVLADRLRNHLKFTHRDNVQVPPHTCKTCGKIFKKKSNLKLHETLHSGLKPYKCPYCDKSFRLPNILLKHKRIHTGEKPYECEVCQRRFSARTNYVVHLRKHRTLPGINDPGETNYPSKGPVYKCNICEVTLHRSSMYLKHMAAHNGEEPKLPCRHCSETFATYKLVKNHLREKHADTLFMCDQCPNFFTTQTALKNHIAAHKEGKQQRCNICVRTFPTKEGLEDHNKSCHVNDTPLTCNVCGKVFKTVLTLRKHQRVHTDERPYQCVYCPKAFRQDTHLANHIRTHTGEKPFVCSVCDKAFGNDNNLRVHMKLHTGEKIECKQCNKVFRSFVKLKEHQDAHPTEDGLYCASPASASTSESNS